MVAKNVCKLVNYMFWVMIMKVLYYYSKLNIGGAERSTVRLLNKMTEKGHKVTLLLRWNGGLLEKELDPSIRIMYLKKEWPNQNKLIKVCNILVQTRLMYGRLLRIKNESYDLVINGLFGYNPSVLFTYVRGKKYCQMLRNDVSKTVQYGRTKEYMQRYGAKFHNYIGVSEYTTESFRKEYPEYSDRSITIYNVLADVNVCEEYAVPEYMSGFDQYFKVLTVCRLVDQAKGLFRMEKICKRLNDKYPNTFKWFIVGTGPDENEFQRRITVDGLNDVMILCGKTDNPFPYYAACDLVAVLSYYEGLCGVVNEAKLMKKPVIATEFSGIYEQIANGKNGMVIENNEESIYVAMCSIIDSPEMIKPWSINGLPDDLLNNDRKVCQFEELLEEK